MILLLILHHIADAGLQPSWLIKNKKKHAFAIYEHSMIWAGMISLGLYVLGEYSITKFLILLVGHFTIDYFKYKTTSYHWTYLDQALHYLQLIIILNL